MKRYHAVLLFLFLPLVACTSLRSPLPTTDAPPPEPLSSTVFAGRAAASSFVDGKWVAVPAFDYEFLVLERRYADRWEAVKEIHYRHPRYDGRAGPRDQTLYFAVRTTPAADGGLDLVVEGTLGKGRGHEEAGSGRTSLELTPAVSGLFVPFDTIRIRQTRGTAEGRLREVVELFSKRDGHELPFMRMEEEGTVYRPVVP